jgi:hypothetical protein
MSYRTKKAGMGSGVPITCPADEQVTPIKAFVNSPDEPDYLQASNWHCVKKSVMAEQAGFTFEAGLKTWANPLFGAVNAITAIPNFLNAPAYSAGLLLPVAAALFLLWPKSEGRRYGR